ncbi:MAG: HlyD family efflux transporter periplasmic adaptor subunit [Butyricicoccus pullicaecorum]|nr:HlyD family efflux transporter periplasmic adaptor subunit [Butyricicoccus pullicaecorum]
MDNKMTTMEQEGKEEAVQGIAEAMDGAAPTEERSVPLEETDAPVRNRYADLMNGPKRRVPRPVKIGLTVLVLAGLFAGGFYLVHKTGEEPEQQSGENTAVATRGYLETYIEGDGQIAARTQVELGKDLKGKVTEVLVQAGQAVKAGDKLFTVDPAEIRKELDEARKDMEEAQRSLDEASSGVTAAEKSVAELTTTAPFTGRMVPPEGDEKTKTWRVGDELPGGTVLGTLVDDTVMKLPLYFSYAYIDDIQKGAAATVSIPANMSTVSGQVESVERIEKVSDDGTRLFRVTIAVSNPGALKKGMAATAEVATAAGKVMPAEAGLLEYSREETVTAKQTGDITRISGLDYYKFAAGAVIVQQANEDLTRAVDTAARTLQSQQHALAEKQKRIAELETIISGAAVTSPIDGVVLKMDTAVDAELAGGTAPCVVADMSTLVVKAQIAMNDINAVMPGQMATLTMYNGAEDMALSGTVESVSMQAEENSGNGSMPTYTAVIVLDPLPEGVSVSMGYYVSYKITTAQSEDCITIPARALVNTDEGTAVFAKPAEGQAFDETIPIPEGTDDIPEGFELVPVAVGISDSSNVEILSGIDEGTEVFLSGPQDMFEEMNSGAFAIG